MTKKKILGIIPARFASTRFPGKPLAIIGGKPMIQRVYEQACQALDDVYIATDDDRIELAVQKFGGKVVMTSVDHQSGTDRCAEALTKIKEIEQREFHAVINIQGDEPFISPKQIASVADCFDDETTQLATLVKPVTSSDDLFNPNKPKVVLSNDKRALYFSRSPIPYLRGEEESQWMEKHKYFNHVGLYGYRTDVLFEITQLAIGQLESAESLEQLRWLENGYSIRVEQTTEESHGIDTPDDLDNLLKLGLI
ncbi:3-deoxy-manno-octulosonate cytidylyltransferase [Carboxylicivirga sediminis]|uniref:3-deoxy-manno-octulosonate cytidylyltransferase n=1 Tax=Carboxylicivirga sediminis TaxID=2006564 RepID=A0A941F0M5_9BACT|nr:3-deoxy-manno-octulosonate cytidylyltransferase [Carboxylicivirga sediminis]MBR8534307.1 3-deoxy-manno-octulosonate cytidylyltransferase [Carboxylicivirga sediminis]